MTHSNQETQFGSQSAQSCDWLSSLFSAPHALCVMVRLVCFVCTPLTISDHPRLHPPTLRFHSNTHCVSSHNHTTPVAGLNSDQCLICYASSASSARPSPFPTPSAYTPVSLQYTLHNLSQPRHSCHRTKLGSMSNFPRLCPYVSGHHLFVFFSICHICLMHFH